MQGIIVFASVMATLGLQLLLESIRQLLSKVLPKDPNVTMGIFKESRRILIGLTPTDYI